MDLAYTQSNSAVQMTQCECWPPTSEGLSAVWALKYIILPISKALLFPEIES